MSGPGRLPDFLLIGAMKSGTTTLYGHLSRHPDVFLSTPKEPQFFSRAHALARGLDWYRSLFDAASPTQLCGEASTCYSRWPHFGDVAARIATHLPNAKLIYLMRHPVDRAYSHYKHLMEERLLEDTGPVISFERALEEIPEILDSSRYLMQIQHHLVHFQREQFLALTLDELRADPDAVLAEVLAFLGIRRVTTPRDSPRVANRMGDRLAQMRTLEALDRLRRRPGISTLIDGLGPSTRARLRAVALRPSIARLWSHSALREHRRIVSPLRFETRRHLLDTLSKPTRDLEGLLQRRLPGWFS